MRWNRKMNGILAAALAASLALPGSALADGPAANEELEDILEYVEESQYDTLLQRDLAFEALGDAIEENGLTFAIDLGMTDGTVQTLDLEGEIPEDGRVSFKVVVDQKLKKWLLGADLWADGETFLDFSIYADQDLLALASSQLYSNAVAIRSGSFNEQFEGSALQMLLEIEDSIPDFNLKFYPDEQDLEALHVEEYLERQEDMQELVQENMRVEKSEADGQTIYTAYIQMEDIRNAYESYMDFYMDILLNLDAVASYEAEEFEEEVDEMLRQMQLLLGDEIPVNYYVQDGLLQKCTFEMVVDPSALEAEYAAEAGNPAQDLAETPLTEIVEGTLEEAGIVDLEASMEVSDEGGMILCEVVFADPAKPYQNFEVSAVVADLDGNEQMSMSLTKETQATEVSERSEYSVMVSEYGEVLYSGPILWSEYNSETGDLNAAIEYADEYDEITFALDSTLNLEKGKLISWQIDSLTAEIDGEAIGLQGSILISSEPEAIAAPEEPAMILELNQGALMGLLTEISYNLEALVAEPEDSYYDDGYYDEYYYDEWATEADDSYYDEWSAETEADMTYSDIVVEEVPVEEAVEVAVA